MASPIEEKNVHSLHEKVEEIGLKEADERLQRLTVNCPPFYKNKNLAFLYLLFIPGCLVPAVNIGFDSAMMNGLQSVPFWQSDFDYPNGPVLGILTAIASLGAICGTPLISIIGDRYGRRAGIFGGALAMMIGGIIQAASVNIAMFLVARFILGVGFILASAFSPILIGELAHPRDRIILTGLYESSWYLGSITAAWTTFGTFSIASSWSWRIPSLLQSVPAVISILCIWFLPESPRWLLANDRHEEARAILMKYHSYGDENNPFVKLEFAQMQSVIALEMANNTGWKTLIATPGNRRRMMIIVGLGVASQWSGNGLIAYYLSKVLNTVGVTSARNQNIINGCLQIFNLLTALVCACLTYVLKRRTQFMISLAGMFTCFAIQTLCSGLFKEQNNIPAGRVTIAMLFLFYFFYNLAFNALLYAYAIEILPYPIRAKGVAVELFVGKASSFLNAFVNPIGLAAIAWKYYIVYVLWLAVEIVFFYFALVETKGPTLEAVTEMFDKKDLVITTKVVIKDEGHHRVITN